MMRVALAVAVVVGMGGCAGRGGVDAARMVREMGLEGAAEALRVRIAGDPKDVDARRALAEVEDRRGRPGSALAELGAVEALSGPLGNRLGKKERARFAELLRARAKVRVERGSTDAVEDLDHARRLVGAGGEDAEVRRAAEIDAAVGLLRGTDPDRRAAGAKAMGTLGGEAKAVAAPETASVEELGAAGLFLWTRGAKRAALELLDAWERAGGRDQGRGDKAAIVDAWLAARAWWQGPRGRPDLSTLQRAVAAGGDACRFAVVEGDFGCDAASALGDADAERTIVARARDRGWRTAEPAEAAAWVVVLERAWRRGQIGSWLDELDARVDLGALGVAATGASRLPASLPAWARAPLLRAGGRADEAKLALARIDEGELEDHAREVVVMERAIAEGEDPPAPAGVKQDRAAVLAASVAAVGEDVEALAEVARAFLRDSAASDRAADDVAARAVDVAAVAPRLGDLFLLLGDPARARIWWQRAVDASPGDVGLRMGLVRAIAEAGEPAAARLELVTAAAGSGDAAATLLEGARVLARAGHLVDALVPAKQAMELLPPGTEGDLLALLVELATALDRDDQVRQFTAALAAIRPARDAATLRARAAAGDAAAVSAAAAADPVDAALAVAAAAAAEPDDARATAHLVRAARWNPTDVTVHAAIAGRGDEAARAEATAALVTIAATPTLPRETRAAAARAVR